MTEILLANIPSPPQGVWYVGPIPIRAYALCIIVGIVVALAITKKRYAARGGDPELVYEAAIVAIPLGIIGGRLYHVLTDHQKYFCDTCNPVDVFKSFNGGLGIWGAVTLGTLGVWVLFRKKGIRLAPFADAAAPAIVLAQAIGRLGNWFNQELYGRETTVPWALDIYYRVNESGQYAPLTGHSTGEVVASVHPTFLYELIWNAFVFAVLILWDKRAHLRGGTVFALYVAGYTLGRLWVEAMRADAATHVLGLRVNIWVSAIVFLLSSVVAAYLYRKQRLETVTVDTEHAPR